MKRATLLAACVAASCLPQSATAAPQEAVSTWGREAASYPSLFDQEVTRSRDFVDGMITAGVTVPQPKDPGGGYTHEQHKRNFRAIYRGGQLYRITRDATLCWPTPSFIRPWANIRLRRTNIPGASSGRC